MINFSALRPETLAGRIVRYPFRLVPKDLTVPILQGPLRGRRWIVGSHLHGCWLGSYECEVQKLLVKEVRPGPGHVFYDIGANVGFYTLLAATLIVSGKVYAFEPLPANLTYIRKHLELNRIGNVEVFGMAICDRVGVASFEAEETRAMGRLAGEGSLPVQTSTLDSLLQEQKILPPDCIKMDIEGTEFGALLGARECFAQYKPKLVLATHGKDVREACCRLLSDWHYEFTYAAQQSEERAELFAWPRPIH